MSNSMTFRRAVPSTRKIRKQGLAKTSPTLSAQTAEKDGPPKSVIQDPKPTTRQVFSQLQRARGASGCYGGGISGCHSGKTGRRTALPSKNQNRKGGERSRLNVRTIYTMDIHSIVICRPERPGRNSVRHALLKD